MGTNGRRQENNGNMSRGTPKIVGSVPNWDFGKGGAHSSKSLPLRIPTGDLGEMTGVRHCAQILNGHLFG